MDNGVMKSTGDRPKPIRPRPPQPPMQHAHAFEVVHGGRIYIEKINGPFLFGEKATPAEYSAGLKYAIEKGRLELHESLTFARITQSGVDLFA